VVPPVAPADGQGKGVGPSYRRQGRNQGGIILISLGGFVKKFSLDQFHIPQGIPRGILIFLPVTGHGPSPMATDLSSSAIRLMGKRFRMFSGVP
jgi:hypothetical protein